MSWRKVSARSSIGAGALATVVVATLAAMMAVALAGCGGADNRPATWSFIAPAIIEPSCATVSCHSAVAQRAGVILDTAAHGYDTLINRGFVVTCPSASDANCKSKAVADSEIMALLRAQGSQRMPPDFALPEADIRLIEAWINNGAQPD